MAPCGKQGISDPDQAVQGWVDAKSAVQHVMTADNPKRYWAFISHSHQDAAWARWLLRSLETYRLPKAIVGQQTAMGPAPRHLKPVFRDRDELAADPDLTGRLERVIEQSHAMIVICSPSAARSEWANEEIKAFRSQNGDQNLFCLIVDGEPNAQLSKKPGLEECFPSALREDANGKTLTSIRQPIAADLRPGGDGKRLALLKIVAGLLGAKGPFATVQEAGKPDLAMPVAGSGAPFARLALLVGRSTLGAPEVLAACLKKGGARTFGERTPGLGVERSRFLLKQGGAVELVSRRWLGLGGEKLDRQGVTPEQVLRLAETDDALAKVLTALAAPIPPPKVAAQAETPVGSSVVAPHLAPKKPNP